MAVYLNQTLSPHIISAEYVHISVSVGCQDVDVTLTQGVDDDCLAPVHQVAHQLEHLQTWEHQDHTVKLRSWCKRRNSLYSLDCFTLLLAQHLVDVSCYIGPSMPSGICMEIHTKIAQKMKKKQSCDEGIPRQAHVYL